MTKAEALEKIEELRRQKTPHSAEKFHRLAVDRYEQIRTDLEAEHHGDFVMIEVDSGDYFLGSTSDEALENAQQAYPEKAYFLFRIGYRAAEKRRRVVAYD